MIQLACYPSKSLPCVHREGLRQFWLVTTVAGSHYLRRGRQRDHVQRGIEQHVRKLVFRRVGVVADRDEGRRYISCKTDGVLDIEVLRNTTSINIPSASEYGSSLTASSPASYWPCMSDPLSRVTSVQVVDGSMSGRYSVRNACPGISFPQPRNVFVIDTPQGLSTVATPGRSQ